MKPSGLDWTQIAQTKIEWIKFKPIWTNQIKIKLFFNQVRINLFNFSILN